MPEAWRPQPKQEQFLSSPADIAIFGGAAGAGKTFALLLEPLRHVRNPQFGAVIFRRTYPQITNKGGLWDESQKIYPHCGGSPRESSVDWQFPSGCGIEFRHMQHENDMHAYQGAQIPLIEFDELTLFTRMQFFYMLSRNRSMCGIRPYVRATCNPDPDSFVADLIAWWIGEDGYPIPERSGVIRWFVVVNDELIWADDPDSLHERYKIAPKSLTFVSATLKDNPALMQADPGYAANLAALPYVERMRLEGGNWKVRPAAGNVFNRAWFDIVDAVPAGGREARFWDFAGTRKELAKDDPDYTVGAKARFVDGTWWYTDVARGQWGPAEVERSFLNLSLQDADAARQLGIPYEVAWEQEPGSAGKRETWRLVRLLAGITAHGIPSRGDKLERAKPLAAQAEVRNVKLLRASWNEAFLNELHNQPEAPHDDQMDAASGVFDVLRGPSGEVKVQPKNPFYWRG